jgi:hypothetical protein
MPPDLADAASFVVWVARKDSKRDQEFVGQRAKAFVVAVIVFVQLACGGDG